MEGIQIFVTLKLRFPEKAKQFQINHLLRFLSNLKTKWNIFAVLEYMNFNKHKRKEKLKIGKCRK